MNIGEKVDSAYKRRIEIYQRERRKWQSVCANCPHSADNKSDSYPLKMIRVQISFAI